MKSRIIRKILEKTADGAPWKVSNGKRKSARRRRKTEWKRRGKKNVGPLRRKASAFGDDEKQATKQLLRKVRVDPELKELGEKLIKTRHTQKGEMIIELQSIGSGCI